MEFENDDCLCLNFWQFTRILPFLYTRDSKGRTFWTVFIHGLNYVLIILKRGRKIFILIIMMYFWTEQCYLISVSSKSINMRSTTALTPKWHYYKYSTFVLLMSTVPIYDRWNKVSTLKTLSILILKDKPPLTWDLTWHIPNYWSFQSRTGSTTIES